MIRKTATLALALLVALPVVAGRLDIDETRPAKPNGEVSVELLAGSVRVIAWDRNEVSVTGTIDGAHEELEIDVDGGEISIEVETREGRYRNGGGADLEIRVPAGSEIEIEAISSDITVEGVTGAVDIEAVSGRIDTRGGMEEVDIECISGSVTIETTAALRRASVETVSGNVELRGALSRNARLNVESVNGNITLRLPRDVSAQFEIETFNGNIQNDFGPQAKRTSEYLPSSELSFSLGAGEARVTVEAFNGTVRLREE